MKHLPMHSLQKDCAWIVFRVFETLAWQHFCRSTFLKLGTMHNRQDIRAFPRLKRFQQNSFRHRQDECSYLLTILFLKQL